MSAVVTMTGVKELDRALKLMSSELNHKVLTAAHSVAAEPLVHRAHLLAPVGETGNLADSIGVVKTPFKKAGVVGEVVAGPRRSRPFRGHHGHLLEFGTKQRHNKSGANRGVTPAQPFMEPAFEQTKDNVIDRIKREIGNKLMTVARRNVRK